MTNTGNGQVDVPKVKEALHDIWVDEIRDNAYKAFDRPLTRFQAKYPGVMEKQVKDRDELLAFHDFPAEHWGRISGRALGPYPGNQLYGVYVFDSQVTHQTNQKLWGAGTHPYINC